MNYDINESMSSLGSIIFFDPKTRTSLHIYTDSKKYKITGLSKNLPTYGVQVSYQALKDILKLLESVRFKKIEKDSSKTSDVKNDVDDDYTLKVDADEQNYNFDMTGDKI